MIKRILLIALTLALLLIPSLAAAEPRTTNGQAESDILILDSSVEIRFPQELVFHLEAQSPSDITDIRLHYQVDKMNYTKITSEGWPIFTPAARIKASWVWDMRKETLVLPTHYLARDRRC